MATGMALVVSSQAGRGGGSKKSKGSYTSNRNNEFLRFVEHTEDAFANSDESAVEEVRRILNDVRTQYDQVHMEAEKKEAELAKFREAIRLADQSHGVGADEFSKTEDSRAALKKHEKDAKKAIKEKQTEKLVYIHMHNRILKEQKLLEEKQQDMLRYLARKVSESDRKILQQERLNRQGAQSSQNLDILEAEIEQERIVREEAHKNMLAALQSKMDAKERRVKFEEWRHEVALDAANEAFNASAGRLRKLYAVEKLSGNCLQKITFEQVERSQNTEDGFQKIREVTGLADVMDIVHKFLNRDVEHEQLKGSVKEAETRLEKLRDAFDKCKQDADVLTFDPDPSSQSRDIYLVVEEHEGRLNQVLKEHEQSRLRFQQSTLQIEHMKRWANRLGRSLAMFEDCARVDKSTDLAQFFLQIQRAVDKFIAHIAQQISSGKVQRKNMSQVASKEYHEARRLLADRDFLKANCRVPPSLDAGRPASRTGPNNEEDSHDAHQQERDRYKHESRERVAGATRKQEQLKKKTNTN